MYPYPSNWIAIPTYVLRKSLVLAKLGFVFESFATTSREDGEFVTVIFSMEDGHSLIVDWLNGEECL
jgi:hypothetical protein